MNVRTLVLMITVAETPSRATAGTTKIISASQLSVGNQILPITGYPAMLVTRAKITKFTHV